MSFYIIAKFTLYFLYAVVNSGTFCHLKHLHLSCTMRLCVSTPDFLTVAFPSKFFQVFAGCDLFGICFCEYRNSLYG